MSTSESELDQAAMLLRTGLADITREFTGHPIRPDTCAAFRGAALALLCRISLTCGYDASAVTVTVIQDPVDRARLLVSFVDIQTGKQITSDLDVIRTMRGF